MRMTFNRLVVASMLVALQVTVWSTSAEAQDRSRDLPRTSPSASVSQVVGVTEITITYGRPSVREREVFGELVPYDRVWRTGADEATTITFTDEVVVGDEEVAAGTYALFSIPGQQEWTIILNEEADQWGAFTYDRERDVVRIAATPEDADFREMVSFQFEEVTDRSATVALYWDEVRVPFEILVDTEEIVRRRADDLVAAADSWQEPLQFAAYAMRNEVYLDEALTWVERSIDIQENFNNLYVKARLLAMQGDYAEAVRTGEQAIERAEASDQQPVTLERLREEMREWERDS